MVNLSLKLLDAVQHIQHKKWVLHKNLSQVDNEFELYSDHDGKVGILDNQNVKQDVVEPRTLFLAVLGVYEEQVSAHADDYQVEYER